MIQITVTMDGKADLTRFTHNLRVNINRSQTRLATRLTNETKFFVETNAPVWSGTLKNRVAMKIFPKTHRGEVFMASPHFNMVAIQNEFNPRGRRKLFKAAYPKIGKWADDKGIFLDKPYVIVGGAGTRLGRANMFFEPSFQQIQQRMPQIASEVIAMAIMKTRA